MLLIECPYCGPRDECEFHYGGEAHIVRPPEPEKLNDDAWSDYVFKRTNPKGWHRERWCHEAGCGRWFNAIRSTVTHAFHAIYPIGATPPPLPGNGESGE